MTMSNICVSQHCNIMFKCLPYGFDFTNNDAFLEDIKRIILFILY